MKFEVRSLKFLFCMATIALSHVAAQTGGSYCSSGGQCIPKYTVAPCASNPNSACTVLAAYDNKQGSNWFANFNGDGSVQSTDGIPNTPFYTQVNGVQQPVVHTNNSNSPGLALMVNNVGSNLFTSAGPNSNSGGRGYCSVTTNGNYSFTATTPFSPGNYIYTLSTGFTCGS